jgi:hypothetical protein
LDDFVKEYKATISLAKLKSNDIVSPGQEDSEDEPEGDDMEMQTHEFTQPPPRSGTTTTGGKQGSQPSNVRPLGNAIPVSKNCVMNVMAAGQVTQKGIEQLVAYLNLIKGSFPANEDEG